MPFNIDAVTNSAYILIGLLYGEGDFSKTLDIATRCGQDSDCNPASAGGILGAMLGYDNIPEKWMRNLREVEDMDFDSVIPAISSGKADFGAAGLTITEERLANVDFTDTYAHATQVIIVTEDSEIAGPDDLVGKSIGVQLGTTGDIYAGDVEDSTVERYKKGFEAVQALSQGKIDAVVIDSEPAKEFVADAEGLKILDEAFTEEDYALAVAKDNEELTKKLNEALANLKESGKLDEIIGKYISADAE